METYKKDQEYTLKVANTDNEVKEIKYTPDKDMSKPEMIMALKAKYKNFFKLIESKLIESDNNIIDTLNTLKDEFLNNLYKDKDKANEVKEQVKQVLQDAPEGTEMCRVVQDTSSGWTSHGSYSHTYTVVKTLKKENGVWEMYGRKKENLDDAVSSIVFNEGILMTRAEAEKEVEKQKVNDTSSHRDIVNIGTDKWGNPIGKSTNRVDYPNKVEEGKKDNSVIVLNYGRGTRFPDRETAIDYYKDCVAGIDPNGAENYAYQNILYSLMHTDKDVVYDIDDETEYDWWVQKGKPTEDISDELLNTIKGGK